MKALYDRSLEHLGVEVVYQLWSFWRSLFRDDAFMHEDNAVVKVEWRGVTRSGKLKIDPYLDELLPPPDWKRFSRDISSFCLAAGCPKADPQDPFKSLEALRDLVGRQFAYTSNLHSRISDLNKQIILQQRMITALAYRDILENLVATLPGRTVTEKWHRFVETMFQNVEDYKIPPDNPFTDLFDQYNMEKKYSLDHLKQMANELYSTLSRTIHNFRPSKDFDQYTPMPGQFDPMQIDFMAAMKPLIKNNNVSGEPMWELERIRYLGQAAVVKETVKPKKQTKGGDEAKKLRSATDGIVFGLQPSLEDFDLEEQVEHSKTGAGFTFEEDSENEDDSADSESE
jgi:hypothetical protein